MKCFHLNTQSWKIFEGGEKKNSSNGKRSAKAEQQKSPAWATSQSVPHPDLPINILLPVDRHHRWPINMRSMSGKERNGSDSSPWFIQNQEDSQIHHNERPPTDINNQTHWSIQAIKDETQRMRRVTYILLALQTAQTQHTDNFAHKYTPWSLESCLIENIDMHFHISCLLWGLYQVETAMQRWTIF